MSDDTAVAQNKRELWRERKGDYYADAIHMTAGGGLEIGCGGSIITMTVRAWHALPASLRAYVDDNDRLRARVTDLVDLLIQVVHCGGQCPPELIAKIEQATQEEAGWTDHIGDANEMVAQPRPAQSPAGAVQWEIDDEVVERAAQAIWKIRSQSDPASIQSVDLARAALEAALNAAAPR